MSLSTIVAICYFNDTAARVAKAQYPVTSNLFYLNVRTDWSAKLMRGLG